MKKDKNTTNVDTQEEQLKKNAEISIEKSITSQTHKPVDLRSKIGKIKSVFNNAEKLGIANNVNESNSELHEIFTEYTRAITALSNGEKSLAIGNSDIKDIGAYIKSLFVKLEKFEKIASQYAKEISIQKGFIEKETKVQTEINGQRGNNGIKSRIKSDASSQIPSEIITTSEDPNILKKKYAKYMPRQDHVSEEKITTVNKPKETSRSSGLIKTNSAGYIDTIGGISYSGKGGILSNLSVFQDKNNDVYQKKREQIITLFSQLVGEDIEKVANAITAQISRKGYHSNNALALKNIIQTLDNFKNVNMGEQINGIFLDEIPQEQSNKFIKNMGVSIDKKELSIGADKDLKEITTTPQNPKGLKLSELNKTINNIKKQRDTFVESHKEDSNADYYKQKIDDYYDQIEQAKQERNAYIEQYVENIPDIAMPQEIEEKLSQNLSEKELTMKKKEYSQQKKKDMVESIKNLADRPNSKNIVSTVNGHQVWEWGEVYNKLDEKKINMQRINREQLYSNEYNAIETENNAIKNTMLQLEQNNMPNKEQEQQKLQQKLLENQQKQREIENRGPQIQQIDAQMSGIVRLLSSAMIDEVNEGDSYLGGKLGEYANADGGKYSSMSKKVFEKISEYSEGLSRLFNVGSWEERNNTSKTPGRISDAIIKGEKRPKNPDEWLAYMQQRKDSNIERENDSSVMLDLETLFENLKNNNQLRSKMTNPNIDEKEKKELTIKMIESIQDIIFNNGGLGQDKNMSYLDSGMNSTIKERLMDQKSAEEDKNFNNLYGSEDLMTLFRNAVSRIFDTMLDNPNNNASDTWFLERQKNLAMKQVDAELNKMGFLYTDKKPLDSTQVGNRLAKIATAQNTIDFNASRISEKTGMDMKESLNTIFDNNESLQEEYSLSEHINNIFSNEGINFSTLKEGDSDYIELQKKVIQIMQSFKDSKYRELQNLYNSLQNLSPKEQLESARLFINQMTKGAFSLNDKVINDDEYVHDYLIPNGDLSPKEKNQMQYTDSTALLYGDNIIDNYNNDDLKSRIQKAENLKQSHMDELKNDEEMFEGMSPEDFDLYEDRKKILEELTSLYKSSFGVTVDDLGNEDIDWDNAINNAPDEDRKQEIINSQQKYMNTQKSLADFKSEKIKQNKQKHQGMIDLIDEDLDRYKRELHSQEIYESFSTNFRQSEEGEKSLNQNINDNSKKKEDGGKRKDSKQEDMDLNNSEDYIVLSTKPTGFNPDDGDIPVSMGVYDPKTNKQNDFLIDFSDKDLNYGAYNLAMNLGLFDEEGNELPENKRNVMQSAKELRTEFFGDKFKDNEVINLDSLSPELQNVFEGKLKEKGQNISDIQDSMMSIIGNKKVAGLNLKDDISLMSNLFETLLGQSNLTDLINKNGIIDATKKENIDNIDNPPTENVSIEDNEPQNPPVLVEPDNKEKQPVAMDAGGDNPPPNGPNNNTPPNNGGNVPPNGNDDINAHSDAINEAIVAEDNKIKKSQELVEQLKKEEQAFRSLNETIGNHVAIMNNATTAEKNKATIAGNNANNVGQSSPLENSPVGPTPPIGNNNTSIGSVVNNGYIDLWSDLGKENAMIDSTLGTNKINVEEVSNAKGLGILELDEEHHYKNRDTKTILDGDSATRMAGVVYGEDFEPNEEYRSKKAIADKIYSGEWTSIDLQEDDGTITTENISSIKDFEDKTGISMRGTKNSLGATLQGNVVHKALEIMRNEGYNSIEELENGQNQEWNNYLDEQKVLYKRIYGEDLDWENSNWRKKTAMINGLGVNIPSDKSKPALAELSLGMQIGDKTILGTLDSFFDDALADYKTTQKVDPKKMGFQLSTLQRLLNANKSEIENTYGITIDDIMNNVRAQIAHVTKDNSWATANQYELMTDEQYAHALNLYQTKKRQNEINYNPQLLDIRGGVFSRAKPFNFGFNDTNRDFINQIEGLESQRGGQNIIDFVRNNGFDTTKVQQEDDGGYVVNIERLDKETGQLLQVVLKLNKFGEILERKYTGKDQEPQESEHEKAYREEYEELQRNRMRVQELNAERNMRSAQGLSTDKIDAELSQLGTEDDINAEITAMRRRYASRYGSHSYDNIESQVDDSLRKDREKSEVKIAGYEGEKAKNARQALEEMYDIRLKMAKFELDGKPLDNLTQEERFYYEQLSEKHSEVQSIVDDYVQSLGEGTEKKNFVRENTIEEKIKQENSARDLSKSKQEDLIYEKQNKSLERQKAILIELAKLKSKKTISKEDELQIKTLEDEDTELETAFWDDLGRMENGPFRDKLLANLASIRGTAKIYAKDLENARNQDNQNAQEQHETKIKTNNAMKDYIKDLQLINKLKRELLALDEEIDKGGTLSGYNLERKKVLEEEIAALQAGLGKYEDGVLSRDGEDYTLNGTQRINFEYNIDNENKDYQRFLNKFNNQNKPGFFSNFFHSIKEQVNQYVGYSLSYQIIGMIRQAIQSAIQQIKQLDQTMVNLQIVTGKNRDEVKSLMSDYNKFAKELGSSTQEVASSANEFLRMGYNIQDTNELIKQSMVLSKVGMIDTAQATEYLTSAIKGYKIAAQDASEVVDMATSLDMKYAVSAGYILEAMSRTANSARLAKVSMSELQSMIAVTGEVTQREASVIGEGFKTAFARYGNLKSNVAVTTDMTGLDEASADELEKVNDIEKVLNKYGISMREADNRTWRSYSDILKDVGQQWSKYSDYEKNAISTAMFGTRQREIGLTTLENYDRVLAANETATYANGSAMEKFNQYLNGVEASVNRLTSAWEGFVQKLNASGVIKKVYDLLTILIENLKLVVITAGAVAVAFNWDKIFVTIAKFSNLFSTKFNSIGTIFSGLLGKSGKKNIKGLWDIIKGKASDAYGEVYQDSIDQQQLVAITHTNSLLTQIYNLIAKKYGEDQLDVNSNPSQNSSSNRQNGDMSMYKWTRWSKKRSAKGKSDFNPVVANMFTTGGLIAGATGGMSIGGQLAKDNNWNEAAGNLIGGALGAGITTAALYMGGPIAAAATGAIIQVGNLIYSQQRKEIEERKQREIKNAQELQQIYTEALGKKNDIKRYDELAKGVTSTGKNKSLTDSEYQEFLTLTDTLGQTFPMLRSVVDETGRRFLGTNGEIGNIGTTTEGLIQQYQKDLANKALSTDVWQTTVDYANLSSQVKDVESEKKLFSINFDDIEENAEEVKYNILKNIKEQGFTEGVDFKYDENNPNKIIFSSDAKVIKQLMPTNPWKDEGKGIISNSDDMSQAVLSGLNNILPYLLQKYDGQLSDIEKTMLIPLLKNIDLNDLQSSDFIDKWFDINNKNGGIHSYGLDDFAPLQEGDAFTRNFGTMVDEVDPIIKSFVEKNQNNEYVKKGFGLEENEELTTDIVKKQLGYDYIDELKEDVKNALGDTSEGFSETTTSFFNQITENQAKQISKISQSEIFSIQQKAVENKTDISTELLKYISMIGGQNASDLFRTVSSLIQSSNKNDVFTDKEIKDIIKNYKETNTLSDNIDESTKSAMDQLIKMSDILNIDLDKMLNNLDILSNIDAMGRVEIKYSEIKEKSDNLKTIKEQLSQGYIDPATLETLSQSNNYEQIIDIMLDPNKGIGDLIDVFNDSLDVLEEVYRGRIKTDIENNNTIYDENRSTIEQPVEGYSATVHNGNELITGSAMFGETHNLANGVANFNKIEDFNIEELRRKYNLENQKNLTEDEFFKFVIESYGDATAQTDFKSAPIETTDEDVKTKEDIVTDVLRSLANAINNYGSFDTVITNAVDTIYNNYFSANNQEKVENAWKLYDFEQQEKNWNKQQKEYNKNKKRYDRQRRKLEKQGRDIDKQERLNELEDFLARRNAIIEAYNSKIENLQWGKDLLSEQDFEGKMDLTRQLMEQELSKQEELKKQFVELQKLNPQSAEEAQKQSEAMKNVASQIKESTKNYLEMEKAINDLSIEALNNTISESFEMINKQMDILSKAANTSDLNKTLISSNVAQSLIGTDFNYSDEEQNEAEKKRDIMEESLRIQQYYEDEYLKSHQDYLDKLKEQNAENIKEQREDLADQIQDLNDQIQEAQDTYNSNYLSFLKQKMEIMIAIPEADLSLTNAQYKLLEEQQTRLGGKMPALFQTDNGLWKSKKKTSDVPKTVKHNYVEGADGTVTEFSGEDKVAVYTKTTRPTPNGEEVIDLIDENGKVVKTFTKKQYNSLIGKKTDEDNPDKDKIPPYLNPMLPTLKGVEADNKKKITDPEKIQKAMVETLQDGLSNMDAKSIINDDVKKKMNEILTQYIKILKSEWDNIISDNEDNSEKIILSFASLLGYTEEEKTTLLDSFKQLGSNVGQSFIDGIGLALNNYAIDKIITLDNGKKYVQSPDQVGFEPIEDVNEKSPLVNTFLKSIDESELSDLIIEKLKTTMELVKKKWTEDIITDEQYQLSKILLDENEWSTDESKTYASGVGYLANDILEAIRNALISALKMYEEIRVDSQYRLYKPYLLYSGRNGWGIDGLGQDILNQLAAVYNKVNDSSDLFKINAPKPDEASWTSFGQEIGKYISDAINQGIQDGEYTRIENGIKVGGSAIPPKEPAKDIGGGDSVYDVMKKLHPTARQTSAYDESDRYGIRSGRKHRGYDLGIAMGADVRTPVAGTVTFAGSNSSYGNYIKIQDNNGYLHYFGHNSKLNVKEGDLVSAGQIIAQAGSTGNSTGPHIHYEVHDPTGNVIDPNNYKPSGFLINNADNNGLVNLVAMLFGLNNQSLGLENGDWQARENYLTHFLRQKGVSNKGIAALLGNLWQESTGYNSKNIQGSFESKLGNDVDYTNKINSGSYSREQFINDKAGYGIGQWTYSTRKAALWDALKGNGYNIDDFGQQVEFLWQELQKSGIIDYMNGDYSLINITKYICDKFFRPGKPNLLGREINARNALSRISHATGTKYHKGGNALLGDQNFLQGKKEPSPETLIYPNGQVEIVGEQGPVIKDIPQGTKVLTTKETKDLFDIIPNYEDGTDVSDYIETKNESNITSNDIEKTDVGNSIEKLIDSTDNLTKTIDEFKKHADTILKANLIYAQNAFNRQAIYKRDMADIWDEKIKNNDNMDYFKLIDYNMYKSNYLQSNVSMEYQSYINVAKKTLKGLQEQFEAETDVTKKRAIGEAMSTVLDQIETWEQHISEVVQSMLSNAQKGVDERQRIYDDIKSIIDSDVSLGFKQLTSGDFAKRTEDLMNIYYNQLGALSEMKTILYNEYKATGKYSEAQIQQLIENNETVKSAEKNLGTILTSVKQNKIEDYENQIKKPNQLKESLSSKYEGLIDNDIKALNDLYFKNNNSLIKNSDMLIRNYEARLADTLLNLSEDERVELIDKLNSEMKNKIQKAYEGVSKVIDANQKSIETDMSNNEGLAKIGVKDTYLRASYQDAQNGYNFDYYAQQAKEINKLIDNANRKYLNAVENAKKEALLLGYKENSTDYNNYIENNQNVRDAYKERLDYEEQFKENQKADLDNMTKKIENEQTLLDLRKQEQWNSTSSINAYYTKTLQNVQQKRAELVDYMQRAKLSREEYEELRMQIAELDHQLYETELNKLKDTQAFYQSQYSAMTYMVGEYTDALNDEKESLSERYDEEIRKLQEVNDSKERSIKLTELQNNLNNAQKERKRVYRAGVGFVYEEDRESIKKAKDELEDFYKEDRLSSLQKAKELETKILDDRVSAWNKYLKAMEKVYKTAERHENMSLLESLFGVSGWNGIWGTLDTDMDQFLKQYEAGEKIYSGSSTELLNKYISISEDIYDKVTKVVDILEKNVPDFYTQDVEITGQADSNLRGIEVKPWKDYDERTNNKPTLDNYNWRTFSYNTYDKNGNVIGSNKVPDYAYALGDEGSAIREMIQKTYNMSEEQASALLRTLQNQKVEELTSKFTTGEFKDVDLHDIFLNGVSNNTGYTLKELRDALLLKMNWMASQLDPNSEEFKKIMQEVDDIGSGTKQMTISLENLLKSKPNVSVDELLEYAGGLIDRSDFVKDNFVNNLLSDTDKGNYLKNLSEDDIQKLLNNLGLESMQTNKLKNQFKFFNNKEFMDGGKYADVDIASILMGKTKNTTEYSLDELVDARLVKTAWNSVNGATDEIKNTNKEFMNQINSGEDLMVDLKSVLGLIDNPTFENVMKYVGSRPLDMSSLLYGADNFKQNMSSTGSVGEFLRNLSSEDLNTLLEKAGVPEGGDREWYSQQLELFKDTVIAINENAETDVNNSTLEDIRNLTQEIKDNLVKYFVSYGENLEDLINGDLSKNVLEEDLLQSAYEQQKALISEAIDKYGNGGGLNGVLDYMDGQNLSMLNGVSYKVFMAALEDKVFDMINKGLLNVYKSDGVTIDELATKRNINKYLRLPENDVSAQNNMLKDFFPSTLPAGLGGIPTEQVVTTGNGIGVNSLPKATSLLTSDRSVIQNNYEMYMIAKENSTFASIVQQANSQAKITNERRA